MTTRLSPAVRELRKLLKRNESLLRAFLDPTADAVVTTDAEGHIARWTDQAERLFGWSAGQALGRPILDVLFPDGPQEGRRALHQFLAPDDDLKDEQPEGPESMTIRHRDGHPLCVELTVRPADLRDMPARNVFVRAARSAPAGSGEAEWLASLGHELRTPTSTILGMTELSLDEDLSPLLRDYVETIRDSAEQLLRLLSDLVDSSRIDAGRFVLDAAPFSLWDAVEETIRGLSPKADAKGLRLHWHIRPDVPDALVGDAGRLRQVLANLLDNAVKFTPHGEVALQVELAADGRDAVTLQFLVTDTGIGIARGALERIFIPFTQADSSIVRRYGGTGLGLAISSEIIRRMGGELAVESEPGRGSCFHFTARFARHNTDERLPASSEGDHEHGRARTLSVLLAEDTPGNQKLVASILARHRHRVDVVQNGREVLDRLKRRHYDLILMDVSMPVMDGFQTTEAIRSLEKSGRPPIPIVGMTAHAGHGDRERCLQAGMDAYIAKPVHARALIDLVERMASAADGREPSPVCDLEAALKRLGGDRELLGGIATFFLEDSADLLRQLREAVEQQDAPRAQRAAHSLKGLAANFDAHAAVESARRAERLAAARKFDQAAEALPALEADISQLQTVLKEHLAL